MSQYKAMNHNLTHNKVQNSRKASMIRYKRSSLPQAFMGSQQIQKDMPSTDIYFDKNKKSKFMKQIVDGYFQQSLYPFLSKRHSNRSAHNQDETQTKQVSTICRNINQIVKGGNASNRIRRRQKNRRMFQSVADQIASPQKPSLIKRKSLHIDRKLQNENYIGYQAPSQYNTPKFQQVSLFQCEDMQGTSSTGTSFNSFLPPIQQLNEQSQKLAKKFPQFNQNAKEVSLRASDKQSKYLIFQNLAFKIYVVQPEGEPVYRLKQFKQAGIQILKREQRALKFDVPRLWQQSKVSSSCYMSHITNPIKNMICKIMPTLQIGMSKFKIKSTNFRKYLLSNQCLQLKHFIRQICFILQKVEGRVLNNKINPSNIFVSKNNKVYLGEWGYSSFRDQFDIQKNKFQSRTAPLLKSQTQWLTTPQYLSPQMLNAVLTESNQAQEYIWQNCSSSDIWSLGLTLFQVLTMIPIWMHEVCMIKNLSKKAKPRIGLLGTSNRKIENILNKQKKLQKNICQCLQNQIQQQIDPLIMELIRSMVKFNPQERITIKEILNKLK